MSNNSGLEVLLLQQNIKQGNKIENNVGGTET